MKYTISDKIGDFREISGDLFIKINAYDQTITYLESGEPDGSIPEYISKYVFTVATGRLKRKDRKVKLEKIQKELESTYTPKHAQESLAKLFRPLSSSFVC